ncbi:hypothetical protein HY442_02455 [Candidatus Parcubacteria bacterium]|nr:hypothetical protein [Candidatus Parcubacteria bacterium]MBI4099362.1 hypothetical protein [Candidatus Parcubacteria bacterium]MBI4385518.1 hypothetical protein [Candidatus Parcubacteria bacterium]
MKFSFSGIWHRLFPRRLGVPTLQVWGKLQLILGVALWGYFLLILVAGILVFFVYAWGPLHRAVVVPPRPPLDQGQYRSVLDLLSRRAELQGEARRLVVPDPF